MMPDTNDGRTHWDGCWRDPGHWECAVARVEFERDQFYRLWVLIQRLDDDAHDHENGWETTILKERFVAFSSETQALKCAVDGDDKFYKSRAKRLKECNDLRGELASARERCERLEAALRPKTKARRR